MKTSKKKSITLSLRLARKNRRGLDSVSSVVTTLCQAMSDRFCTLTSSNHQQFTAERLTFKMHRRTVNFKRHKYVKTKSRKIIVPIISDDSEKGLINYWHEPDALQMNQKVNQAVIEATTSKGLKNPLSYCNFASLKADKFKEVNILVPESEAPALRTEEMRRMGMDPTLPYDCQTPEDLIRGLESHPPMCLREIDELHKSYAGKQIEESKHWAQTRIEDFFKPKSVVSENKQADKGVNSGS